MKKTDTSNVVPLSALNPTQLKGLKENLDAEIQALTGHVVELRYALKRFEESKKGLDGLGALAEGREVMVPLTQSVYVPAKLVETDSVLIDIGTGYHAKVTIRHAKEHCENKIKLIGENCSVALKVISEKKRFAEALNSYRSSSSQQK